MSKYSLGIGVLALAVSCSAVPAAWGDTALAYDGFGGPPRFDLAGSTGGTGWSGPWIDQSYDIATGIGGPGLSYPGLVTTPGAAVTPAGSGVYPSSQYYRSFGPLPAESNDLYVSFLMRADAGYGIWGGLSFGSYPFAMNVGSPPGYYSFGLMVSEGLGDVSNAPLVEGQTNLVVLRISKNTPASGSGWRLYLNPTVGQAEPSFPIAQFGLGPVSSLPTSLRLDNGGGFTTDEIRVGTTWASVLPAIQVCEGDLNHDGTVDGADLGILLGAWGTPAGDMTGNGTTDGADLGALLGAWGACP